MEEAKSGVEAALAERQAEVEALQGEVAGLKDSLAALQAQLGERWRRGPACVQAGYSDSLGAALSPEKAARR